MTSAHSPEPLVAVHRAFARWGCRGLAPSLLHPAAPLQVPVHSIDVLQSVTLLWHAAVFACKGTKRLICLNDSALVAHFTIGASGK